ncbi:MAG: hypothetical protein J6C23_00985 [Clostridia bacterium]|nr:hypothetical protein [Clostridia bacterium]
MASFINSEYRPTVDVKSIDVVTSVGKKDDAMASALLYALAERLLFSAIRYVADTQQVIASYKGEVSNENTAWIYVSVSVNVSIALIVKELIAFAVGKIKYNAKFDKIKKEKYINVNGTKGQTA